MILIAFLSAFLLGVQGQCGITNSRIVVDTLQNEYPWLVYLLVDNVNSQTCDGTLISDEWVLTSAACLNGASFIDVFLGAHNLRNESDGRIEVRTREFVIHPEYSDPTKGANIALVKLPLPVTLSRTIAPICLPTVEDSVDNILDLDIEATGFGMMLVPVKLDAIALPATECTSTIAATDQFCVTQESGGTTGQLQLLQTADGTIPKRIIGLHSYFVDVQKPDVYTLIAPYLDWVQSNTM